MFDHVKFGVSDYVGGKLLPQGTRTARRSYCLGGAADVRCRA